MNLEKDSLYRSQEGRIFSSLKGIGMIYDL